MAWTEDRVAFIRAQYLEGRKSASEIAALLGDVTREAVCGKLYRIGARRQGPPVRRKKIRILDPESPQNAAPGTKTGWQSRYLIPGASGDTGGKGDPVS